MIKFDNKYLQDIGDIVISQDRVIFLVLGCNAIGQQQGYILFDMREYKLEDKEYVQTRCTDEFKERLIKKMVDSFTFYYNV